MPESTKFASGNNVKDVEEIKKDIEDEEDARKRKFAKGVGVSTAAIGK